ncbi:hypothetical protein ABNF52_19725, partial [Paenibacillus larvae]
EGYEYGSFHFLEPSFLHNYTDSTWEEWTQKRILAPLGMQNTYLTLEEVKQTENYALPYVK